MSKKLIYIVDDEEDILDVLGMILQKAGYAYKGFLKPEEALSTLVLDKPAAILSDFRMPNMNGVELLRAVRTKDATLPFIIISAHIEKTQMIDAIDAGVNAVIEKPFRDHDVIIKLNKALSSN